MIRFRRWRRGIRLILAAGFCGTAMGTNCLNTEIVKRFRDGFETGLSGALNNSGNSQGSENSQIDIGQAVTRALLGGVGAAIQPRTPASSSSGNTSNDTSSSG